MTREIGLIGTGWIGSTVAQAIDAGQVNARLAALHDLNSAAVHQLVDTLRSKPAILSISELIERTDLVIDAAGASSLEAIVPACRAKRRDLIVLSVGGLAARPDWLEAAA